MRHHLQMRARLHRRWNRRRRLFTATPSRQILNALTFQAHLSLIIEDLSQPEGLRRNSALLELARLAPEAARILARLEEILETAPPTLRGELVRAHDAAWDLFELQVDGRRAA